MKICPVKLFENANLSQSSSSDGRTFPRNSITKQPRTICNILKKYLANIASAVKIPSTQLKL